MKTSKAKKLWEEYGSSDPYFGVSTFDRFRSVSLDEESREDFFHSGEEYVEGIWAEVRKHFDDDFSPKSAVDFGCGVGRILIPLATRCTTVLGLDISRNMLNHARQNCEKRGSSNITFGLSDDDLSELRDKFDFIHSFIVFQHIRPTIGLRHVEKLIDHLNEGGIGILHFTYANPSGRLSRLRFFVYREIPLIYKIRNLMLGGKGEPLIPMYKYDLNAVLEMIQSKGCLDSYLKFTDHGYKGAIMFFRKNSTANKT